MRLVIAEKHSVAQAIGQALGDSESHDGYITAGGVLISWAQGHLVGLAMPDAYQGEAWADPHWSMESLPVAPAAWKWAVSHEKGADKRYRELVALASRDDVDELVNACDPDREGEAIFRRVMEHAGIDKPSLRLWVASLDEHAIRDAWRSMRPESDYRGLGDAADARAKADWLVGMNASRAHTVAYRRRLSVGRVQTPTLAMVADRDRQIAHHVEKPFWKVVVPMGGWTLTGERLDDRTDAEALKSIVDAPDFTFQVFSVQRRTVHERPPRLYDLTGLQKDMSRLHGLTAARTLAALQSLYEKRLATYPRTDSQYITHDDLDTLRDLAKGPGRGAWAAKSKKEYDLDENGERIRLPSGRYKTHKIDLTGWNDKDNTLLWRKAWADYTNDFLERNGSPERIDHRSNAERGIDEIPTVHMGVAACQMEKKGIATEKGELNRNIQKANRLIREIRAQIGKLKEWIADLFKARETAPKQPPQSPNLANLLMKYLSVQREKSRKYSQSWQRQHATDELKTIAAAVNYLSEHGISNLDELDASLSSVSDKAFSIREGMKTAEQRMKELQKLMEYGRNYQTYKPIQDEYRQIRWKGKQEKFAEARRAELTLWDAANRYLHAHLPEGVKTLPISAWEKEYTALKAQREAEYDTLKETRAEVAELQKIRRCVDIALRADQPEQTQSRTKRHEQER